jgi:hypothetical protein
MKNFDKTLEERGIIKKGNKIWVSGGMIVNLILRGNMTNEEYKKLLLLTCPEETRDEWLKHAKILEDFERRNKCRLIYNNDKVFVKKVRY